VYDVQKGKMSIEDGSIRSVQSKKRTKRKKPHRGKENAQTPFPCATPKPGHPTKVIKTN
jgi:hypothetical protein